MKIVQNRAYYKDVPSLGSRKHLVKSNPSDDYTAQLVGRTTFIVSPDSQSVHFDHGASGSADYNAGDIVGDSYKLISQLGRGGMGVVYVAEHTVFGQQYALKLLAPEQTSQTVWQRFKIEGQVLAKLDHQNIVKIYNMGIDKRGCPFYVMTLLRGAALADVTAHLPVQAPGGFLSANDTEQFSDFTAADILRIYNQVCSGLGVAHGKGIIHRDIKPSNIIVTGPAAAPDSIKIVDFGLAAMTANNRDKQSLTMAGEVFGSPLFMSPEQSLGEKVDQRSDIYSLGCSLYQSLTGKPPFIGSNALETLLMHQQSRIPTLAEGAPYASFSPDIEVLVSRLLEKNPDERYQNIELVKQDIERVLAGKSLSLRAKSILPDTKFVMDNSRHDNNRHDNTRNDGTEGSGTNSRSLVLITIGVIVLWSTFGLGALVYNDNFQKAALKKKLYAQSFATTNPYPNPNPKLKPKPKPDDDAIVGPELPNETADLTSAEVRKYQRELAETSKIAPTTVIQHGRKYRRYVFPNDIKFGGIHFLDDSVDIKGVTLAPLERGRLFFSAAPPALCYPPLFEKLKDENFEGLSIVHANPILPLEQVVEAAANWPRLKDFTIDECDIGHFDFNCLSKLKNLIHIEIMETNMDTDAAADWPGLANMHYIKISGISHANKLMSRAFAAPNLEFLSLAKTPIRPETLDVLGRNPAVSVITLRECKFDNDDVIRALTGPNLQEVYILEPKVDQRILEKLKQFPKLKRINITMYHLFSVAAIKQFKKDMPHTLCQFETDQYFGRP